MNHKHAAGAISWFFICDNWALGVYGCSCDPFNSYALISIRSSLSPFEHCFSVDHQVRSASNWTESKIDCKLARPMFLLKWNGNSIRSFLLFQRFLGHKRRRRGAAALRRTRECLIKFYYSGGRLPSGDGQGKQCRNFSSSSNYYPRESIERELFLLSIPIVQLEQNWRGKRQETTHNSAYYGNNFTPVSFTSAGYCFYFVSLICRVIIFIWRPYHKESIFGGKLQGIIHFRFFTRVQVEM